MKGHAKNDEEIALMSSEPHEKPHQPEAEEPIFYPRQKFHKYNYVVNLSKMADLAEGGELHVGQLDLHTNPNGTMKEGVQPHARFVWWSKPLCDSSTR